MTSRAAAEFVVLLPAYNEEKRIGRLVREIRNFVSRVVVVDDGSFDATALRAKEAGADVLRREQNGGKGEALRDGIEYVLKNYDCEAILLMDADGQHKAEDINKFLEFWKTKKPDFIIGVRDFSPEKMPFLRRVWNAAISRIVSALTGTRLRDSQCGFRLLSRRAAEKIKLKRRGYFTETEMIFEAAAGGFKAEEVPVETVYFPDNGRLNFFAALKRSFIILFFTAGKAFTTERVTLLLRWSAALLLLVFSYQALDKIDSPFLGKQENFAQELRAATDWLKSNSEPDAVVMAHWFRGHQLVAFADRRVVSTTKVYPSEAAEVAGRYRDIAGFFLTEDEEEARQIALRYRASYIFLDRDFQGWLCKAINRCEVTTNNRSSLNRRGILNTVAGRMTQGGDFKHFKKVWDSPRFLIYEVTDQPREFSASEKEVILALARETLTRFVRDGQKVDAEFFRPYLEERGLWEKFSEHRDTDVTVWIDGALRASRISSGNTLTENLVKAAADAADDRRFAPIMKDELPKMRIEAIVFKDDRAPLTKDKIAANAIDVLKGYRITDGERKVYFLPEIFVAAQYNSLQNLLSALCRKGGFAQNCYRNLDVEVFNVEDFMEGKAGGGLLDLSGPVPASPSDFSEGLLAERIRLAADWLLNIQRENGSFTFKINPLNGSESKNLDWGRNALAGQALAEAFKTTGDYRYLVAAEKNALYFKNLLQALGKRGTALPPSVPYLNFAIMENVSLHEATGNYAYLSEARKLAKMLLGRLSAAGSFGSGEIADYQAFYALARLAKASDDKEIADKLLELSKIYEERFRAGRILKNNSMSLAVNAWLVNDFRVLYNLTRNPADADFAFEVAGWLADYQITEGAAAKRGAFFNTPKNEYIYTRGTGKAAEGIADAYILSRELNLDKLAERHQSVLSGALQWLMRMQFTAESSYFIPAKNQLLVVGGFRHDLLNQELWNDSAAHFILAASTYLQHESDF